MRPELKHLDAAIKQLEPARRRMKFIASQQVVDRDGDVIITAGIDTADFERNPALLLDHDPRAPLGRVLAFSLERPAGIPALVGEAEVLPAGSSARADEAWAAIQFGARAGISIGFLPLEVDPRPVLPDQRGVTFRRSKLLEISSVVIPSCPTCVVTEKASAVTVIVRQVLAEIENDPAWIARQAVNEYFRRSPMRS